MKISAIGSLNIAIVIGVGLATGGCQDAPPSQSSPAPAERASVAVDPVPDAYEEYQARFSALSEQYRALNEKIKELAERNKRFDRPEYDPCAADNQGGVGRCVSDQAAVLESAHNVFIEERTSLGDGLEVLNQYRAAQLRHRAFLLAHGMDVSATNDTLQDLRKANASLQNLLPQVQAALDRTDTKYIQAMLSGKVVTSKTPLEAVPESIRNPDKKSACVETIAKARTYRNPTIPAGFGSLSDEERHSTPGYWEEGGRVANDWASMNAAVKSACEFGVSLWR